MASQRCVACASAPRRPSKRVSRRRPTSAQMIVLESRPAASNVRGMLGLLQRTGTAAYVHACQRQPCHEGSPCCPGLGPYAWQGTHCRQAASIMHKAKRVYVYGILLLIT
jgi:hypothetical protein